MKQLSVFGIYNLTIISIRFLKLLSLDFFTGDAKPSVKLIHSIILKRINEVSLLQSYSYTSELPQVNIITSTIIQLYIRITTGKYHNLRRVVIPDMTTFTHPSPSVDKSYVVR